MKSINPIYAGVFVLCAMGIWGCSQQKSGTIGAKIRDLETRYAKLEEDYRTQHLATEQQRKRSVQLETQRAALEKEKTELARVLEDTTKERDILQKQISQRILERDAAQTNLTQFNKDLQALASRVESALNGNSTSPSTTIIPASRRTE